MLPTFSLSRPLLEAKAKAKAEAEAALASRASRASLAYALALAEEEAAPAAAAQRRDLTRTLGCLTIVVAIVGAAAHLKNPDLATKGKELLSKAAKATKPHQVKISVTVTGVVLALLGVAVKRRKAEEEREERRVALRVAVLNEMKKRRDASSSSSSIGPIHTTRRRGGEAPAPASGAEGEATAPEEEL